MTVKMEFNDNMLIIDVRDHPDLYAGRYSLVLRNQGFTKSEVDHKYYLEDPVKIRSTIEDLVAFFRRKNIAFETSDRFNELKDHISLERAVFEKAQVQGLHTKDQNEFSEELIIPGFMRKLKPYQQKAVRHMLAVENTANFSVPGSGKTTMLYAGFSAWRNRGEVEKLLVIGPPSSFMAWEDEYTDCFGREPMNYRLIGPDREHRYRTAERADILLTSFQTAANDCDRLIELMKQYKIMLVVDESHYIKRFENGIWANALLKMAPYAVHRAISTGTPMPNGLFDLYSQLTFLWPSKFLLGEQAAYKAEVKRNEGSTGWIQSRMRPFFYRINKADLELPPVEMMRVVVPMSPYQKDIYNLIAAKTIEELNRFSSREIVEISRFRKAKIIRLMQASSNPALLSSYSEEFLVPPLAYQGGDFVDLIEKYTQYEKPNKIVKAVELAKELIGQGHKVLLWSTFVINIFQLQQDLVGDNVPTYLIYGGVPKSEEEDEEFNREQQIRHFKSSKEPCVLIANPAACAESISLHKDCHHAIYLDRSFNCGHYLQSLDRIHRIGLDEEQKTYYYFMESADSLDEVIHQRLLEKEWMMRSIIEEDLPVGSLDLSGDGWNHDSELQHDFDSVIDHIRVRIKA